MEKLPRVPSWILKLVVFHICLGVIYLIMKLFLPTALEGAETLPMLLLLYVMSLVCFILYDVCLTRLITFYFVKLRNRLRIKP